MAIESPKSPKSPAYVESPFGEEQNLALIQHPNSALSVLLNKAKSKLITPYSHTHFAVDNSWKFSVRLFYIEKNEIKNKPINRDRFLPLITQPYVIHSRDLYYKVDETESKNFKEKKEEKIKIGVSVFYNISEGEVNFGKPKIDIAFDLKMRLELKLYFPYSKIENVDVTSKDIPAVFLISNSYKEFKYLLSYLKINEIQKINNELDLAYHTQFYEQIAYSRDIYQIINFYNNTPSEVVLNIALSFSNIHKIFEAHLVRIANERIIEEAKENAILNLLAYWMLGGKGTKETSRELADYLLKLMLNVRIDNQAMFELFLDKMNNIGGKPNFDRFALTLHRIWRYSSFTSGDEKTLKLFEEGKYSGLFFIPIKTEKTAGFYFPSFVAEPISGNNASMKVVYETGEVEYKTVVYELTPRSVESEVTSIAIFHPFQPVGLIKVGKDNFAYEALNEETIIPAFLLRVSSIKAFWSNITTGTEYALDILTTLSGVGNVAKFRHLAKLATKAKTFRYVSEAGKKAVAVKKAVAAITTAVEISSGSINALLKLTGFKETETGQAISEYLFWLELLSLSGELTVAIHSGLKKSAKKILEKEDEVAKHLDDLVGNGQITRKQADDLIEELEEIAEEKIRGFNISHIFEEGVDYSKLPSIVNTIRKKTFMKNFDIIVVDKNNQKFAKLFQAWQKNPGIEGVFMPRSGRYNRYRMDLEGPKVYILEGYTVEGYFKISKHVLQHEMYHVEMHAMLMQKLGVEKYKLLIEKIPTHIKEEYVVHRFLNSKNKVTDTLEIDEEIVRINRDYRPDKNNPLTEDYLRKTWNLKIELKKLNINY